MSTTFSLLHFRCFFFSHIISSDNLLCQDFVTFIKSFTIELSLFLLCLHVVIVIVQSLCIFYVNIKHQSLDTRAIAGSQHQLTASPCSVMFTVYCISNKSLYTDTSSPFHKTNSNGDQREREKELVLLSERFASASPQRNLSLNPFSQTPRFKSVLASG